MNTERSFNVDCFLAPLDRALALSTENGEVEPMSDGPLGLQPGKYTFTYTYPVRFSTQHTLDAKASAIDVALLVVRDYTAARDIGDISSIDALYFEGFTIVGREVRADVTE